MRAAKKCLNFLFLLVLILPLTGTLGNAQDESEAVYYTPGDDKTVQCLLCPRTCVIPEGQRGFCGVRENQKGHLYSLSYGRPVALHIDPIEKKPLFHFFPDSKAFSVATAGCNLRCLFCQNWEISQKRPEELSFIGLTPAALAQKAIESGAGVIAFTYTEPTVFFEYMLETARYARQKGLKTVIHSSGYINEAPLRELCHYLDAANIDLKGFSEDFYVRLSQGHLEPVLRSLKILKEEGVHLEITNLIIPGYNDDLKLIKMMCEWIRDNLGNQTPLHFSRFHPMYKLLAVNPTPVAVLEKAREVALETGLKYVYIGNVPGHLSENTYCPNCHKIVIERRGYFIVSKHIINGSCEFCGETITGIWE